MRAWPGLIALLLALVAASPAAAGGTLLPDELSQVRGEPVFAGERLAWATPDAVPDGYRIHVANVDGSGRLTRTIEAPIRRPVTETWFALGASDRRIAASLHLIHCTPACKTQLFDHPYSKVLSARGDGPFEPFSEPCVRSFYAYSSVAVDGDVVAHVTCSQVVVHDFGAPEGEQREFRLPGEMRVRLAGPYVVSSEGSRGAIVREWRTGAERLQVAAVPASYGDLGPDGTLVFVDNGRVMAASPSAPEPRVVAEGAGGRVELAGDRVAYTLSGGGTAVRRLDGTLVAESRTAGLSDFNGERVAWLDETCARSAIATWDLQGEPPSLPRANPCPFAALRSSVLRVKTTRAGASSVGVKLACAPDPPVGCQGEVELLAADSRRKHAGRLVYLGSGWYRLAPGGRTTLELMVDRDLVCRAGRNALRPVVEIRSQTSPRGGESRVKKRRVRVVGLEKALRACAA